MKVLYPALTKDSDVNLHRVLAVLVLGLEHILAGHFPACLEDEHLGIVAGRIHPHYFSRVNFLLEREEDLGVL